MKYPERIIKHNIIEPDSIVPEHIKMKEVNWTKTISHHVKSIDRYVPYGLVVDGVRYAVKEIFERNGCLIGILSYDEKHFYELQLSFMDDKLIKEIQEELNKTKTSVKNNSDRIDRLEKKTGVSAQTLSIRDRTVSISGGNSIELPPDKDTIYDDSDLKRRVKTLEDKPDRENQRLEINGRTVTITGGNSIELPPDKDTIYDDSDLKRRVKTLEDKPDRENQRLEINGRTVTITGGNSIELPEDHDTVYDDTALKKRVADLEAKPDNDKQTLSINDRTISISNGNSIKLPAPTIDGGDNLICNSAFPENTDGWGLWEPSNNGGNPNLSINKHSFYYNNTQNMFVLKSPTDNEVPAATKRFPVKRNTTYSLNVSMFGTDNIKRVTIYFLGRKSGETETYSSVVTVKFIPGSPPTNGLVRYYCTFDVGESDEGFIRINNGGNSNSARTSYLYFTELDVYEGISPRAWQMSPKCLKSMIDAKVDNDRQTLSVSGNNLSISNGNTVQLPVTPAYNDTDVKSRISALEAKPDNDKQTLSLDGYELSISNGNTVQLPKAISITQRGIGPSTDYINIGSDAYGLTLDIDLMKLLKDFKSGKLNQYIDDTI